MSILKEVVDLMDVACKNMNLTYSDIRICELGDQMMWHGCSFRTGKDYFVAKGVKEHISIDWNGKNGALKRDLANPVNEWKGYFDMVTNHGTTEHVWNQYQVFRNIHNFCRPGGTMIHAVPIIGGWAKHCSFHYDTVFFDLLAECAGYKCITNENRLVSYRGSGRNASIDKTDVCAILLKEKDVDFVSELDFPKVNKI